MQSILLRQPVVPDIVDISAAGRGKDNGFKRVIIRSLRRDLAQPALNARILRVLSSADLSDGSFHLKEKVKASVLRFASGIFGREPTHRQYSDLGGWNVGVGAAPVRAADVACTTWCRTAVPTLSPGAVGSPNSTAEAVRYPRSTGAGRAPAR
jgi:hypothetical protein